MTTASASQNRKRKSAPRTRHFPMSGGIAFQGESQIAPVICTPLVLPAAERCVEGTQP